MTTNFIKETFDDNRSIYENIYILDIKKELSMRKDEPLLRYFEYTIIPYTKTLSLHTFTTINGKKFKGYIYQGKQWLTLKQIQQHLENTNYKQLKMAFYRIRKKLPVFAGDHYIRIDGNKLLPSGKARGEFVYLLSASMTLLLVANLRNKEKEFYVQLVEYYVNNEMKKQKFMNYQPKDVFLLPEMAGKKYTKNMDLVDSRGEIIIADILYDLGIPYQVGVYFKALGISADFVIKTEPKTVIEYWGIENKEDYLNKRKHKEAIYRSLGWRLINIEAKEVENVPKLMEKIRKLF